MDRAFTLTLATVIVAVVTGSSASSDAYEDTFIVKEGKPLAAIAIAKDGERPRIQKDFDEITMREAGSKWKTPFSGVHGTVWNPRHLVRGDNNRHGFGRKFPIIHQ